jgi:hypothetical protein
MNGCRQDQLDQLILPQIDQGMIQGFNGTPFGEHGRIGQAEHSGGNHLILTDLFGELVNPMPSLIDHAQAFQGNLGYGLQMIHGRFNFRVAGDFDLHMLR